LTLLFYNELGGFAMSRRSDGLRRIWMLGRGSLVAVIMMLIVIVVFAVSNEV